MTPCSEKEASYNNQVTLTKPIKEMFYDPHSYKFMRP